jgi:hypothetical protein
MASKRATAKKATTAKLPKAKPTTFVGLTADEGVMLADLHSRGRLKFRATGLPSPVIGARKVEATFWDHCNFTVARLFVTERNGRKRELVGVSKCNPRDDEYDAGRGRKVALARAARGEATIQ